MNCGIQNKISSQYGSDIDPNCLEAASCNTAMLTREGMLAARDKFLRNERTTDVRTNMSTEQLNESVEKLLPYLNNTAMQSSVFMYDIFSALPSLPEPADYFFTDISYGRNYD